MSASGDSKATKTDDKSSSQPAAKEPKAATNKLEEDDEFEDFPVEDWTKEDTEVPGGNDHLWEESWDDDDTTDDFSQQLREELKTVKGEKA